jgi:calcium-binding protein CML
MTETPSAYSWEIRQLYETFKLFDLDGNGTISASELDAMLRKVGAPHTDAQVKAVLAEYDVNGDGEIEFGEFVLHYLHKVAELPKPLHDAFAGLDHDDDGLVELAELQAAAGAIWNNALTPQQVAELTGQHDANHDGKLTYGELVDLLLDDRPPEADE